MKTIALSMRFDDLTLKSLDHAFVAKALGKAVSREFARAASSADREPDEGFDIEIIVRPLPCEGRPA